MLVWPSQWGHGHQNLIISFPCPIGVSVQVWSNPPIGSGDKVQTRLIFTIFIVWWKLKIRSRSPKSNQIFKPSQRFNIWSLAHIRHLVQEIGCRQAFFLVKIWKFQSLYSVVTLKIRSRSPKSNQIFKPSPYYNIWSLATIRHLSQEIGCRQAFLSKFQSASVILKMRSRSPKTYHFFPPSQ